MLWTLWVLWMPQELQMMWVLQMIYPLVPRQTHRHHYDLDQRQHHTPPQIASVWQQGEVFRWRSNRVLDGSLWTEEARDPMGRHQPRCIVRDLGTQPHALCQAEVTQPPLLPCTGLEAHQVRWRWGLDRVWSQVVDPRPLRWPRTHLEGRPGSFYCLVE